MGLLGHRRFRGGMQGDRVATPRLAKIVVSATMTRDPSKIGQLQLHSPLLLTVGASDQRCASCTRPQREPALTLQQVPASAAAGAVAGGRVCG